MGLGPYFRAVLGNLDFFLQREDPARVVSMVRMLQAHAQMVRGSLMISVSTDGLDPAIKQELSSIADMVLSFKVRTIGTTLRIPWSFQSSKRSGEPQDSGVRVTPEEGIPKTGTYRLTCTVDQTTCPKRSGVRQVPWGSDSDRGYDASGIDADAWEVLEEQLEATIPNYDRANTWMTFGRQAMATKRQNHAQPGMKVLEVDAARVRLRRIWLAWI